MTNDGSLFLMEVLIDKVSFLKSPCFSDKDFRTCVSVTAPSVELEIYDDDPGQCIAQSGGPFVKTFNSGKSSLFFLKDEDIAKAMSRFPIQVTVYKSLPCGCLPTKIIMGQVTIDMTKEFVQTRNKYLQDPVGDSCQALKDTFQIVSLEGAPTGTIVIFFRISCFGKYIITRFQDSGPPTLGAERGPSSVDRSCNPQRQYQTSDDPCVCGASRLAVDGKGVPNAGPPCQHGGGGSRAGPCPIARDPYNSKPCEDPDDICYCAGPKPPPKQPIACRKMDPYSSHMPKGPSNHFEEIRSVLGDNELKMKVQASSSIIQKISQTHCAMQTPEMKTDSEGPCIPSYGKNKISVALPSEATCCNGIRAQGTQFTCTPDGCLQAMLARGDAKNEYPSKDVFILLIKTAVDDDKKYKLELELVTPKGDDDMKIETKPDSLFRYCCPTGNKVIFQMPSDTCGMNHKQRAHFHFTSDGLGDVSRDDPSQLVPTTAEDYPGVVYDMPQQVIKLRIKKVIEQPGRKSKFDYQFITPAVPQPKVIPVIDTRTAQCVPTCPDCCSHQSPKRKL